MNNTQKVELYPAFSWDCEDCGRNNFVPGMTIEDDFSDEEGVWIMQPDEVTCGKCGSVFETKHYSEED
jgi:hypothetical protein